MDDNPGFTNHPFLGTDRQVKHFQNILPVNQLSKDYGHVHNNAGIPSAVFRDVSLNLGGDSWDRPGRIWHLALQNADANDDFSTFSRRTMNAARTLYNTQVENAVAQCWRGRGVNPADDPQHQFSVSTSSNFSSLAIARAAAGAVVAIILGRMYYASKQPVDQ
jgi:hypothetical protein